MQLIVHAAEAGIKLLDFLARSLGPAVPMAQLHRWVRTGQVRINSKRAKPFDRLAAHDAVRLPPFAAPLVSEYSAKEITPVAGQSIGPGLKVLAVTDELLVLDKASGLATQPGSGLVDSASQQLADFFSGSPYIPAPAHRLDKETSGLLLAGRTHAAQRKIHELLTTEAQERALVKEYLAWVPGTWPCVTPFVMEDFLEKGVEETGPYQGKETMRVAQGAGGQKALATVLPCSVPVHGHDEASLLLVRLHTGRTHQIRVQLASRGFALYGDRKYGGPQAPRLLLHAYRIVLPDGQEFRSLPPWPAPFAVASASCHHAAPLLYGTPIDQQ